MAHNYTVLLSSLLVGCSGYTAGRGSDPGLHKASLILFRVPDEGVTFPGTGSFSWQKHKRPSHTLQAQIYDPCSRVWSVVILLGKAQGPAPQPDLVGWASPHQGTNSAQMLQDRFFFKSVLQDSFKDGKGMIFSHFTSIL